MSITVDKKYINLLSPSLMLFKWESNKTATCRCPICGDSKRNKRKKRGYFYQLDTNSYLFKCYNCGYTARIQSLLKQLDMNLYNQYMYEKFQYSNQLKWKEYNTEKKSKVLKKYYRGQSALSQLKSIEQLEDSHFAKLYCIKRKIPQQFWNMLYYTENYIKWISENVSKDKFKTIPEKDQRLVIPFFTKSKTPFAFQGRYIGEKPIDQSLRYITINETNYPLIYGLDRLDLNQRINVVEGPIDSLFVPNCIAAAGSSLKKVKTGRKIFDNQPRNKQIIDLMKKSIDNGDEIVVWSNEVSEKDINDLVKNLNWSLEQVSQYLDSRTFQGLSALLEFEEWKKI